MEVLYWNIQRYQVGSMSKAIQFKKNGENIYPCPYYPIGAVYISVDSTNPGNIFGGTWEQIKGRFLLGVGQPSANSDNAWGTIGSTNYNSSAGTTGGQSVHTLTISEMPNHDHNILCGYGDIGSPSMSTDALRYQYWGGNNRGWHNFLVQSKGDNVAHNNMPPYFAVYMWRRIK